MKRNKKGDKKLLEVKSSSPTKVVINSIPSYPSEMETHQLVQGDHITYSLADLSEHYRQNFQFNHQSCSSMNTPQTSSKKSSTFRQSTQGRHSLQKGEELKYSVPPTTSFDKFNELQDTVLVSEEDV